MRPGLRNDAFAPLLLVCVVVHAALVSWRPRYYIADDALFYLQIAYNVAQGHGFTFSDLMPTNGFHPFWLLVCIPLAWLVSSKAQLLTSVIVLIVLLNAVTLIATRDLFRRVAVPQPSAAVLFSAPYLFFVAIGMEGHLSALLLALTMRAAHAFAAEASAANLFRTAWLAGMVVFARLDLAILLAPLGLWTVVRFLARARDRTSRFQSLTLAACLAAAPVAAFLLINALEFGTPIPVSGLLKLKGAGLTAFSINGIAVLYLVVAMAGAIAAALQPRDDFGWIHICLSVGVLAFLFYVLSTSEAYTWYYYGWAVVAMSGVAVVLRCASSLANALGSSTLVRAPQALALVAALFGIASMVRYGERADVPYRPPPFGRGEASLAMRAARASIQRVFAFDRPGELAFYHGLSVLAADGLTTNPVFQRKLAENGIDWALERYRIQAVVVPRLGTTYGEDLCGSVYLSSLRFSCDGDPAQISRFEVFSRFNGAPLGSVDLAGRSRLAFDPDEDLVVVLLDEER